MNTGIKRITVFCVCVSICASPVLANPVGGTVVGGGATINGQGTPVTTVNQSANRVIINWQDFSIAQGELTRFVQPSASASALNRVVSGNPSLIYGSLQANGRVFVINPNGILVGPGGQIDTKAFVASTLDIPDSSFMSGGNLIFSGSSDAAIRNQGTIQALGGDVFLIAHNVENSGTINAPQGTVGLAAGSQVQLVQSGNERLSVLAGNPSASAEAGVANVGTIQAASAELKAAGGNIYALAINNGGVVRATGISTRNGRVVLTTDGGNIQNSGTIAANNADGSGGTVVVNGGHNETAPATVISSGTISARGDAAGTKGGSVEVLGDRVGLLGNATVDVSGNAGGGSALIGGGFHGEGTVQNAEFTQVAPGASISADAISSGDGGRIAIWADDTAWFLGGASAKGGANSGSGGFVEISGKEGLVFNGDVDTRAPHGAVGTVLFDPTTITIHDAGDGAQGNDGQLPDLSNATRGAGIFNISETALEALSANAAIILEATGDIIMNNLVDNVLNLALTTGSLVIRADTDGNDTGNFTMDTTDTIRTQGGAVSILGALTGSGLTLTIGAIDTTGNGAVPAGGAVTLTADNMAFPGSGITAGSATAILQPRTANRVVNVENGATGLDLTDADLDKITAGTLRIGSATSGDLTVGGALTQSGKDLNFMTGGAFASTGGSTITTAGNRNVTVVADSINIGAAINVTAGRVTLQPLTAIGITLGGAVGGTLSLQAGDINNVTAGVLQIGNNNAGAGAISGAMAINGDIAPAGATTLSLQTGGAISQTAGDILNVPNLALRSGSTITLNEDNTVTTLAASAGGALAYHDADSLTINTVDGLNGVTAGANPVTLTAAGDNNLLTITAGQNVSGSAVTLVADRMAIDGTLTTAGTALLRQDSNTRLITLGTDDNSVATAGGGTLGLTDTELDRITAGTLQVGDQNSGDLSVTAAISPANAPTLSLVSGGTIGQTPGSTITVPNLIALTRLNGGATITLTELNEVNSINLRARNGADSADANGTIQYNDATGFSAGQVTSAGNISLTAQTGNILDDGSTANAVASSGAAALTTVTALAGNIGTSANPLDIGSSGATATVGLNASAGAVHVNVLTSGGIEFLTSTDNGADITTSFAQGTRTYNATYVDGAAGDFTLSAAANIHDDVAPITILDPLATLFLRSTLAGGTIGAGAAPIFVSAATLRLSTTGPGGNATVTGGSGLNLGASTVNGSLTAVASAGNITDSGAVAVTGPASFTASTPGASIILDSGLNLSGTIALQTFGLGDATVVNANGLNFATTTIGRNLIATATAGNITDSGTLTVTGNADFTAAPGASILLDSILNRFDGTLNFLSSGPGNLNNVTIVDTTGIAFQTLTISGNLDATAGGPITQTGALNIGGDATFITRNDTAQDINLFLTIAGNPVNNFGSLTARTLNGAGAAAVAGAITIREQGDTDLRGLDTLGDAAIFSSGNITDSGTLTVGNDATFVTANDAPKNITLDEVNSTFGTVAAGTFDTAAAVGVAGTISIRESGDMDIRGVMTTANATFRATGNITDNPSASLLTIGGDATFLTLNNAGGNLITLDSLAWNLGTLTARTLNSAGAVAVNGTINIFESGDMDLRQVQTLGNATLTSSGNITDSGTSIIGGDAAFVTQNNTPMNITLDDTSSTFGSVSARTLDSSLIATVGGTINIFESGDMDLRQAQTLAGATFTSSGNITDSGTLTIGGNAAFITRNNGGANITLDELASTFGSLTARTLNGAGAATAAGTINIFESGDTDLSQVDTTAGASFSATADITDSGTVAIGGAANFTTTAARSIILNSPANNFGGTVAFNTSGGGNLNNVTVVDNSPFTIPALTINGIFDVTAVGAVNQSGNLIAPGLRVSASGPVTLNNNNDVNVIAAAVGGAGNAFSFTDVDDLAVGVVNGLSGIATANGAVTLSADTLQVAATVASGTARTTLQPFSAGRVIDVGTEIVGRMSLTDAELDLVTAAVLQIGSASAGLIDVSAPVSPANAPVLALVNNAAVSGAGSVTVGSLRISSPGAVTLAGNNDVNTLAIATTGGGNPITFRDVDDLSIGSVDGVNGVTANNGNVTVVTVSGPLTVNNTAAPNDVNSGSGSVTLTAGGVNNVLTVAAGAAVNGSGGVVLTADDMNIAGTVDSGAGRTTLQGLTAGVGIDLGTDTAGVLGLTDAELDRISASVLQIGSASAGAINVSAAISPANATVLALINNGPVTQTGGSITVPQLRISAGPGLALVTLTGNNDVDTLAASAAGLSFTDIDDLTIGQVDGVSGISVNFGAVVLSADAMAINQPIVNSTFAGSVLLQTTTPGAAINLGAEAGGLSLTDAELDLITASVLQIGNVLAGAINVVGAVSPANTPVLSLVNNGGISGAGSVTVPSLRITTPGAVTLNGANDVNTLAANVTGAGNGFAFADVDDLVVGTVDGVSGIATANGDVTLRADTLQIGPLGQTLNAGTARATLLPFTAGRTISLGAEVPTSLSLTDFEIDLINAGTLQIGDFSSGTMTVVGAITPALVTTLSLRSGGSILEDSASFISVSALNLQSVAPPNAAAEDPIESGGGDGIVVNFFGQNIINQLSASGQPIYFRTFNEAMGLNLQVDGNGDLSTIGFVPVNSVIVRPSGEVFALSSASLAALSSAIIPAPKLDTTSFSGSSVSTDDAAQILPAGSIGTLWLQLPFGVTLERRYKVEDLSKWTSGRIAAVGSTAGPQTPN